MSSPVTVRPWLGLALRWSARAISLISIGVLMLFLTGQDGLIANWAKVRPAEWGALLFFPFGVMLGLALAWWRELPGALLAAASVAAFYAYCALLSGRVPTGPWFLIFAAPAALFFASSLAHRRVRTAHPA